MRLRAWRRREAAGKTRRGDFRTCVSGVLISRKELHVFISAGCWTVGKKVGVSCFIGYWEALGTCRELICLSLSPPLFRFLVSCFGCFLPVILLVQHALLLSRSIDTHIIYSLRSALLIIFYLGTHGNSIDQNACPVRPSGMHLFAVVRRPG
jgi:hypothetical protein